MLVIELPETEFFDRKESKIRKYEAVTLRLEHSLLSISKWESIWEVPFLGEAKKTDEQLRSYVEIMAGGDLPPDTLQRFTKADYDKLNAYLNAKHSATWFSDDGKRKTHTQTVTSELVYFWMTSYNIPFECENWPFARLMNLIRIAAIKNDPDAGKKKNRSKAQMLSERAALNKKRREQYGTTG